jgi:hypothetical protein
MTRAHLKQSREFDALRAYPSGGQRIVAGRGIRQRIIASARGAEFFDGDRACGYGGLHDDGRWGPVAEFMIKAYALAEGARITQIQCEKGFLLREFDRRGMQVAGFDSSFYAVQHSVIDIQWRDPRSLPESWVQNQDLVIAIGAVYVHTLPDAIRVLREIQRVTRRHAFVTLAAYDSEDDLRLLRAWSLLGETILTRADWLEVMAEAGYTGDYKFVTAKTLGLAWH